METSFRPPGSWALAKPRSIASSKSMALPTCLRTSNSGPIADLFRITPQPQPGKSSHRATQRMVLRGQARTWRKPARQRSRNQMSILMVTGIEGARDCAALIAAQLGMEVEVAEGRKAALSALRRKEYSAVVVDETIAECDPAAAEAICERAGLAIPLQINFALSGAARLIREIRAALQRREREQELARRAAAA